MGGKARGMGQGNQRTAFITDRQLAVFLVRER